MSEFRREEPLEYPSEFVLDVAIERVWAEYSEFEDLGLPYIAFVLMQDILSMEEDDWDEEECVEELADVIIIARRAMLERGRIPNDEVLARLENHAEKDPNKLVEKYVQQYSDSDSVAGSESDV